MALDYALAFKNCIPDYRLDPNKPSDANAIKLLKLHGSLNWALCECGDLIEFSMQEYIKRRQKVAFTFDLNANDLRDRIPIYEMMNQLRKEHKHKNEISPQKSIESGFRFRPAIIPPTWTKSEYYQPMKNVWKEAAFELSEAENVYIVGYSLPETDAFFPYLYSLATLDSSTQIERFWVFNIDGSPEIKGRYKGMVGKGIERSYQFFNMDFSEAIEKMLPYA